MFDWLTQIIKPSVLGPFARRLDGVLLDQLQRVASAFPTAADDAHLVLDPGFTLDRVTQKLRHGGAGMRLPSESMHHAFINTLYKVMPLLCGDGRRRGGILPDLAAAVGAGSFGPTNARQRWAGFLNTDLSYASEFRECYDILHQRDDELLQRLTAGGADHASVDALRASSPALAPIEQLGMLIGGEEVENRKLGKAERYFYLTARKVEMDQRALALPSTAPDGVSERGPVLVGDLPHALARRRPHFVRAQGGTVRVLGPALAGCDDSAGPGNQDDQAGQDGAR
jgi:hypothetical protein